MRLNASTSLYQLPFSLLWFTFRPGLSMLLLFSFLSPEPPSSRVGGCSSLILVVLEVSVVLCGSRSLCNPSELKLS